MTDRTFAERLRETIDNDDDLTESGLAIKAGLSNATIRKLLAGNTKNPRVDTARKVCAALGISLEEFMSNAHTDEEHEIVRLALRLPDHLLQQLLGYGKFLEQQADQAPPKSDADK